MFRTRREVFRVLNSAPQVGPEYTLQPALISSTYGEFDSTLGEMPPAPRGVRPIGSPSPNLGAPVDLMLQASAPVAYGRLINQ
jgi:hypothetical protein